jgi:hypothetical protein
MGVGRKCRPSRSLRRHLIALATFGLTSSRRVSERQNGVCEQAKHPKFGRRRCRGAILKLDAYRRPSHNSPWTTCQHWQILEIRYAPRASSKRADLKSITSLHEDYPGKPGFLGCYHQKSWVTDAAARAAIDQFRAWVDGGRRKQTAAATARSNQPAAEDVVLLPERYSERRNFRVWVGAMLRPVSRASGVVVKLMLLASVHTTTRDEYNRA